MRYVSRLRLIYSQDAEAMRELLKDVEEGEERNSVPEAQGMGHLWAQFRAPVFFKPRAAYRARFLLKCFVEKRFFCLGAIV